MGYNVTGLTAYVDQTSTELLMKSVVLGMDSIDLISSQPNVVGTRALQLLDLDVTIQDATSCSFNPNGSDKFTQRQLSTIPLKTNKKWCLKDLNSTYLQVEGQNILFNNTLPFEQVFTDGINAKIADLNGKNLWQGIKGSTSSTYNDFDGVCTITGMTQVTGFTTGATVYDVVLKIYNSIPQSIKGKSYIIMGKDSFETLVQDLIAKNNFNFGANVGSYVLNIPGTDFKVYGRNDLSGSKRIYSIYKENVWYGYNVAGDNANYKIWINFEDEICFKEEWYAGVQVAYPEDVLYAIHN